MFREFQFRATKSETKIKRVINSLLQANFKYDAACECQKQIQSKK